MHFYQFHIGDYKSHTHHLSLIEDLAFRRLLDHYYLHEAPIRQRDIARQIGMREHEQEVLTVLDEFFMSTEDGFIHPRADAEIAKYRKLSEDGKRGAAKRWDKGGDSPPIATPIATKNQEPITNNHKPKKDATDVAFVYPDWLPLETWDAFIKMRKRIKKPPTDYAIKLLINKLDGFRAKGQDVQAILERSITSSWQDLYEIVEVKQPVNRYDAITTTVPGSKEKDPALVKLEEDAKRAAAPSVETLARLAALRKELKS